MLDTYKIILDKQGKIALSCTPAARSAIKRVITILDDIAGQIEEFGAMEMSGEIGEAAWHLKNLLKCAVITEEG